MRFFRTTLLCGLITTLVATGNAVAEENSKSRSSFDSLQNCLAIDGASLNVVFLIDKSKSMQDTDPQFVRSKIVKSSLEVFHQVSRDSKRQLNYTYISFGNRGQTKVDIAWRPITKRNIVRESANVVKAAKQDNSPGTNWLAGLIEARDQIESQKITKKNACFILSWLTDGEIDLNPNGTEFVKADRDAFGQICNEQSGLINYFRKPDNNIATLGALLSENFANLQDNKGNSLSAKKKSVQLFRAVIAGEGKVNPDVQSMFELEVQENKYQCGRITDESNLGEFETGSDPKELLWKFVDLIAKVRGLSKATVSQSGNVQIDGAVGMLEVFEKGGTSKKQIKVLDAAGKNVCRISNVCKVTENSWIVNIPKSGVSNGSWDVQVSGTEEFKVYLGHKGAFKTLRLQIEPAPNSIQVFEGDLFKAKVRVVDQDGKQVSVTDLSEVCIQQLEPTESTCEDESITFPIEFRVAVSDKKISMVAEYKFSGASESGELQLSSALKVRSKGSFAKLSCNQQDDEPCVLKPIPNGQKTSENKLFASVEKGKSTITITGFYADDIADRKDSYEYKASESSEITAKNPATLDFSLRNEEIKSQAEDVTGYIQYETSNADGSIVVKTELKVVFAIEQQKNMARLIGLYVLFILIGIGLPYLLLLLQARKSAVFVNESFRFITVPIIVTPGGKLISPRVETEDKSESEIENQLATIEQFIEPNSKELSSYIDIAPKSKSLSVGPATIAIKPIRFDALSPVAVSLSIPDSLIYASTGSLARKLVVGCSSADQSLTDSYFIHSGISSLDCKEVQDTEIEESADFDAPESGFRVTNSLTVDESGLVASITLVLTDTVPASKALKRFTENLKNSDFSSLIIQLQELRQAKLDSDLAVLAQREHLAKMQNSKNIPSSENSKKRVVDHFDDDFDFAGPVNSTKTIGDLDDEF